LSTNIAITEDENEFENHDNRYLEIEQLQRLANKRRQLLEAQRTYKKTNQQWVTIVQTWDEENPCK